MNRPFMRGVSGMLRNRPGKERLLPSVQRRRRLPLGARSIVKEPRYVSPAAR